MKTIINSIITFIHKNYLLFLPDLSIFAIAIISWFLKEFFNISVSLIMYVILFLLVTVSIYVKMYFWRKLQLSVSSYIFFMLNVLQFCLFIWSFYIIIFHLKNPIYLANLSVFSQYRYLIFSCIMISFLILYVIIYLFKLDVQDRLSFFTYPYLKENVRNLLYTWNEPFFGNIFSRVIDWLGASMFNRILFIIIHFLIFYMYRIIILFLFFQFTFFHGDLRLILYLIPVSFFIWLLNFIHYYFKTFFEGSYNYVQSLVSCSIINELNTSSFMGIIKTNSNNFSYELTTEATSLGYTYEDLPYLGSEHLMLSGISVVFTKYFQFVRIFRIILLLGQMINWLIIVNFYFLDKSFIIFATNPLMRLGTIGTNFFSRSYASEIFRVKSFAQKKLEEVSQGSYKKGHNVIADTAVRNPDNPKEVLFEGQPTHGSGSVTNPSYPLNPNTDFQGNPKPQNWVPPVNKTTYIKESDLQKPSIPGSKTYLEDSRVKENMAKQMPEEEKT